MEQFDGVDDYAPPASPLRTPGGAFAERGAGDVDDGMGDMDAVEAEVEEAEEETEVVKRDERAAVGLLFNVLVICVVILTDISSCTPWSTIIGPPVYMYTWIAERYNRVPYDAYWHIKHRRMTHQPVMSPTPMIG